MAGLSEAMLKQVLAELQSLREQVATKDDLARIESRLETIDKIVVRGNGQEPLVTQVRLQRQDLEQFKAGCPGRHLELMATQTNKKQDFFREKLLAPIVASVVSGVSVGLIIAYMIK